MNLYKLSREFRNYIFDYIFENIRDKNGEILHPSTRIILRNGDLFFLLNDQIDKEYKLYFHIRSGKIVGVMNHIIRKL